MLYEIREIDSRRQQAARRIFIAGIDRGRVFQLTIAPEIVSANPIRNQFAGVVKGGITHIGSREVVLIQQRGKGFASRASKNRTKHGISNVEYKNADPGWWTSGSLPNNSNASLSFA
jgi:hypothetical protein